jgi:hypothetical protein
MSKIRIAIATALVIASAFAGGLARDHSSTAPTSHVVAGSPPFCC